MFGDADAVHGALEVAPGDRHAEDLRVYRPGEMGLLRGLAYQRSLYAEVGTVSEQRSVVAAWAKPCHSSAEVRMMNNAIRRIQEQQEMIRRLAEGPAAEFLRRQDALAGAAEIGRRLEVETAAALVTQLSTTDFLRQFETAERVLGQVMARFSTPEFIRAVEAAARTQERLGEFARSALVTYESAGNQLVTMSHHIDAALRAMSTIDFDRIGALLAVTEGARLAHATEALLLRHTHLVEAFSENPGLIGQMPPSVADLPAMDLFVHSAAVRAVTPHEPEEQGDEHLAAPLHVIVDETALFLEETLPQLKPAFLAQYRGLRARAAAPGPDFWTQGGASMRKLLKGVLHTVAPNEDVLPWANANRRPLDRLGRPTRGTKADWLCKYLESDPYRLYMRAELEAALELINLLDTTQHVDDLPEFADGYELIVARVEVSVRHMLTLWLTAKSR